MPENLLLGVHCSVSGGLQNAFIQAEEMELDTFQIFTRNQRQWKAKPIASEENDAFQAELKKSGVKTMFSHTSYLINLASESDDNRQNSITALQQEVERCTILGLSYCVLHPGAAGDQPFDVAIDRIADGLQQVLDATSNSNVMILLENTAGQGSSVGGPFENLGEIYKRVNSPRIGYCFDTCHAFAAGYDIRTKDGFEDTFDKLDKILGLQNLKAFHLNDSKGELGSHLDRHEHIGKGKLGIEPFRQVMQRFKHIPKVIETPKEGDWDEVNIKTLRDLA